jgi:hypothetical protein
MGYSEGWPDGHPSPEQSDGDRTGIAYDHYWLSVQRLPQPVIPDADRAAG